MTTLLPPRTVHEMGPLREAGHAGGLRDVFRKRYLLWLLVRKEIKVRYKASALGLLWSYAQPLARFCVYYFIASLIVSGKTPSRMLHIFSGLIMLHFFTTAMTSGAQAIIKNKSLIRKITMPREMFPVAAVAVTIYNVAPWYVILLLGDFLQHWHPDAGAIAAALLGFGVALIYGLALAIFLSAANVFVRDTSNAVGVMHTLIRWTAPVIYTYSMILPTLQQHPFIHQLYVWNPFNAAVMLNNRAFWIPSFPATPEHPDAIGYGVATQLPAHLFERGLVILVLGFVFLGLAQAFFIRVEGRFADKL